MGAAAGFWRTVAVEDAEPAEIGLARLQALADEADAVPGAPVLLVWRSQQALLVTRQDSQLPGFQQASERLSAAGWPVVLRKGGGSACPVSPGTVQVAAIAPVVPGRTMDGEYEALTELIRRVLRAFGITAYSGLIADAYCPGRFDLSIANKKIAGLSQRWFRNCHGLQCVTTTASINADEPPALLAGVVNAFYGAAGSRARCNANSLACIGSSTGRADIGNVPLALAFHRVLVSVTGETDGARRGTIPILLPLKSTASCAR